MPIPTSRALTASALAARTMIDLHRVRSADRLSEWRSAVPSLFPGMELDHCETVPNRGSIQHTQLAKSHAWLIDSSPVKAVYHPRGIQPAKTGFISLMLQLRGSTTVHQKPRSCELEAGQFCLIDNQQPFVLDVTRQYSCFLAWQLPREQTLSLHPRADKLTAYSYGTRDRVGKMIRDQIVQALEVSSYLTAHQQAVVLNNFIRLLAILDSPEQPHQHWRISRALGVIERSLTDSHFNAESAAEEQGISRRQLDRMFRRALGVTVTARIWERRLSYAADVLKDPAHAQRSITDVALSCGFESPAHFTRSFKTSYKLTPSEWRVQHALHPTGRAADV